MSGSLCATIEKECAVAGVGEALILICRTMGVPEASTGLY